MSDSIDHVARLGSTCDLWNCYVALSQGGFKRVSVPYGIFGQAAYLMRPGHDDGGFDMLFRREASAVGCSYSEAVTNVILRLWEDDAIVRPYYDNYVVTGRARQLSLDFEAEQRQRETAWRKANSIIGSDLPPAFD